MNATWLLPAFVAATVIYCLMRGVRILKTGTATVGDIFPVGGWVVPYRLRQIRIQGWSARLAALPQLIVGLGFATAVCMMLPGLLGSDSKGGGAAKATKAPASASVSGAAWLDRISASLASLTRPTPSKAKADGPPAAANANPPAATVIRELTEEEFASFTNTPNKLPVVIFYRDGDGPSQMVQQEIQAVALEFPGRVEITRVNIERFPKLAERQGIQVLPDIRYFRNGKRVDQVTGSASAAMLRMRFQQLAPALPAPVVAVAEPVAVLPSGSGSMTRMKKDWMPPGVQRR